MTIALQIGTEHWFYLYIVWFLPMLLIAITWRPTDSGAPGRRIDRVSDLAPRQAAESTSKLIRWMGVQDANSAGSIHGGTVLRFIDEAAGLAAIKHSGRRVVTAGLDRMTFLEPVFVAELLSCTATVNAAGAARWRSASGSRRRTRSPARSAIRARPT